MTAEQIYVELIGRARQKAANTVVVRHKINRMGMLVPAYGKHVYIHTTPREPGQKVRVQTWYNERQQITRVTTLL